MSSRWLVVVVLDVKDLDVEVEVVIACARCLSCFSMFLLDALLLVLLLLLVVEELLDLLVRFFVVLEVVYLLCMHCCPASFVWLFCGVSDVLVRIIEVLCSEFKDVEVVNLPLFDVQFNDSIVARLSLQDWRCHTLGVDVCRVVVIVRGNSLDVDEASRLDVLHKEVAQCDVLGALVEPKPVAETQCRCAVGEDVDR